MEISIYFHPDIIDYDLEFRIIIILIVIILIDLELYRSIFMTFNIITICKSGVTRDKYTFLYFLEIN